jgi:Ca-activated chloride channel family protein
MTFAAPWHVLLILLAPIGFVLYRLAKQRNKAALDRLIGAGMKARDERVYAAEGPSRLPSLWTLLAVSVLFTLALMQPIWGERSEDAPRRGRDVVALLDTSLSMLARDAQSNRIENAKAMVRRMVQAVKADGGHRLALMAFAGRPSLQCPLTLDYDLFLKRLDETSVETVGYEGSLIGDAIHHALERLGGLKPGFADMILVTDGEDHGGLPIEAARAAAAAGVDLYAIGVGDPEVGAPIPVVDEDGAETLLEYDGFEVRSKVDVELLADMAQLTDGRFLGAKGNADTLADLYHQSLAAKPRRALEGEATAMPAHRFQWFVGLALLLLVLDQLGAGKRAWAT